MHRTTLQNKFTGPKCPKYATVEKPCAEKTVKWNSRETLLGLTSKHFHLRSWPLISVTCQLGLGGRKENTLGSESPRTLPCPDSPSCPSLALQGVTDATKHWKDKRTNWNMSARDGMELRPKNGLRLRQIRNQWKTNLSMKQKQKPGEGKESFQKFFFLRQSLSSYSVVGGVEMQT